MNDRLSWAREELARQYAQARAITQSLNALQAGRPDDAPIQLRKDKLLEMESTAGAKQLELLIEIERLEGAQLSASDSGSPGPALAATSAHAAETNKEPPRKTQRTLANWLLMRPSEDSLVFKKLDGPLLIASTLRPCPGCGSEKKDMNGLREHMRHCEAVKVQEKQRLEAARALEAARSPRSPDRDSEMSEESEESDAESHEGHALAPLVAAPTLSSSGAAAPKPKSNRRGQAVRKSYSVMFKLRVITFVEAWNDGSSHKKGAQARAAEIFGVHEAMVSKWIKARDSIVTCARKMLGARGRGNIGRLVLRAPRGAQPRYAVAEALVFGKFLGARQKNRAVSGRALKVWMRKAVANVYKGDVRATEFKASTSWLNKFKARHNIVTRARTNKKVLAIETRLPAVQKFHRDLRAFISQPGGADHEVYGRFAPAAIFNVDQSPIALQPGSATTLEQRGAVRVQIAERDSGDKRYCTLQLTVSPGVQQVKPMIIFRGQGKRLSAQEKASWDPRVHVEFQPNAWVDGGMVEKYVSKVLKPFLIQGEIAEALLLMDNLAAQQTEEVRALYEDNGIKAFFFPPNVTDLVQPVDHHLAQQLKKTMADMLDDRLLENEAFAQRWLGLEDGTLPAWEVRVALTRLVADAWADVCQKRDFVKLFQETGCLMPKLGVDATGVAPIKIAGVDVYSFELAPGQEAIQEASLPLPPVPPLPPPPPPPDDDPLISEDEGEEAEAAAADNTAAQETDVVPMSLTAGAAVPPPLPTANSPSMNVDEEEDQLPLDVDVDSDRNELADETTDESAWGAGPPIAPEGFGFANQPTSMPAARTLINRKLLWAIPVTASGAPGWIVSMVGGGPLTPSSALMGVTMRLKCTKRLDKATPSDLLKEPVEVAFSLDNYGKRWYMLEEEA